MAGPKNARARLEPPSAIAAKATAEPSRTDPTIGADFTLHVWPKRFFSRDRLTFRLTRNEMGWRVSQWQSGDCDKGAGPLLYELLHHDSVDYPASLPERLEHLWESARNEPLSRRQVQAALNALSKWIDKIEFGKPARGFWLHYG